MIAKDSIRMHQIPQIYPVAASAPDKRETICHARLKKKDFCLCRISTEDAGLL